MLGIVDKYAQEIAEAEDRDRQRWPIIRAGRWHDEIINLKDWLRSRITWLESEMLEEPDFRSTGGKNIPPFQLTITNDNPGGILYYTLDGSDPMLTDGTISPRAQRSDGAELSIREDTLVKARVLVGKTWTPLAKSAFTKTTPALSFSEIMFDPTGGRDYEFIEIFNHGG